jgi:hypothetical protein
MTIKIPQPISKHELKRDIATFETKFTNKTSTLSQFFSDSVINSWDLAKLNAAQLVTLHEAISRKPRASFIVLELRKS